VYNERAMTTLENSQAVPLTVWEDGSIRVVGSRVTLDSIVHEFKLGATAEQVLHSFPSVTLREVYGAIFYYLNNTEAVEEYLRQREQGAEETRRFIETRLDTKSLRERILARRDQLVGK
jgi:uncharacterized protein (DUF433 family)